MWQSHTKALLLSVITRSTKREQVYQLKDQASDRRIAHNYFNTVQFINIDRPMKSLKISLLHWEYWPNLKVAISPKSERPRPPKLVCMHLISTPTCMNFLNQSNRLHFLMTMDSPWLKGKFGCF